MVFFFCDVYNILVIYLWMDDGNYYMLILDRDKYFKISKFRSVHVAPHPTKGTYVHNQIICRGEAGDAVESRLYNFLLHT